MTYACSKWKSFLPVLHGGSIEAATSGNFFEKSSFLKDVTAESAHVLSGESMLDAL